MKISWRRFFRHVATTCMIGVAGCSTWNSAVCYALSASDNASDPVYADGWQGQTHDAAGIQLTAGDNGGFGFTQWNFDTGYVAPDGTHYGNYGGGLWGVDDGLQTGTASSSTFNNIGKSWRLAHPTETGQQGTPRAGRGFSPLQVGQTLSVVFDNPTQRQFFKGYFIRLSGGTGGIKGNICNADDQGCSPGGTPVRKMYLSRFEYFDDGEWGIVDSAAQGLEYTPTGLFDTDTAAAGAKFQLTRTGADTYDVLLDTFGPAGSFTLSETFANPGAPVDWIEFIIFNRPTNPAQATDFYIRSIEISDASIAGDFDMDGDVDGRDFLLWQRNTSVGNLADWQTNFGAGGPLTATLGAVPEPTSLLLVGAGLAAGLLPWRKQRVD